MIMPEGKLYQGQKDGKEDFASPGDEDLIALKFGPSYL